MSSTHEADVVESLRANLGEESAPSPWLDVKQEYMDRFAEATLDPDWMHIDPERARAEGLDGTIAFGFWTISMLTYFTRTVQGAEYPPGVRYGFNYGLEHVRLISPVPVGARIRNRSRLVDVVDKGGGRVLLKTENTVEIEGQDKPAMVAQRLTRFYY